MEKLDFEMIGLKIKERRNFLGITQESIANVLNVDPSHISNIECNHAHPSLTTLINIANILECSVDYFINHEYTFNTNKNTDTSLDTQIQRKIKYCDTNKKQRILKMIDLL